jgi:hypothetical protein
LLGLGLLTIAIGIPGCQALFPRDTGHGTPTVLQSSDSEK